MLAGPSFEEPPIGKFAEEDRSLAQCKKIFLLAAGAAVEKFREQLAEQEEIVAALANIVMDIYAMESSLRRAQKSLARGAAGELMADAVRGFIYRAMDRIEAEARTALAATARRGHPHHAIADSEAIRQACSARCDCYPAACGGCSAFSESISVRRTLIDVRLTATASSAHTCGMPSWHQGRLVKKLRNVQSIIPSRKTFSLLPP